MSENLLNEGDEVVKINHRFSGNVYYTFSKVVRVTKTTATLESGTILKREGRRWHPNLPYDFKVKGQYYGDSWQISTPQIKAAAAAEQERQSINTWFKDYQFTDADKKTICELFKNKP